MVASTPVHDAAAALRDVYLLRITSELAEGVHGYALDMDGARPAAAQLMFLLYWLAVLDHLWCARVEQRETTYQDAQHAARDMFPSPDHASQLHDVLQATSTLPASAPQPRAPGAPELPPYGVTDRVRLRDELLHVREQLFAWMRDQLGVPRPPPTEDDEDERDDMPFGLQHDPNVVAGLAAGTDALRREEAERGHRASWPLVYDDDAADRPAGDDAPGPDDQPAPSGALEPDDSLGQRDAPERDDAAEPGATPILDRALPDATEGPGTLSPPEESTDARADETEHYAQLFKHKVRGLR